VFVGWVLALFYTGQVNNDNSSNKIVLNLVHIEIVGKKLFEV